MANDLVPQQGSGGLDIKPLGELQIAAKSASALQEIQGAIFLAKQFPRDEQTVFGKLMTACRRASLAKAAAYAFPRGGATVTGPSVNIARVAAQVYGNVRWGLDVIRSDEDEMTIEGWAWDIENNVKVTAQDHFKKLIYRKAGGWIKPDERDLRELVNRRGAILVRNCLLQILPKDLIEDALAICKQTLVKGIKDPKGESKQLIVDFGAYNVTVEMLQEYAQSKEWDAETIIELQGVLNSIREGNTKVRDHFFKKEEEATDPPPTITPGQMSAGDTSSHQGYETEPKGENKAGF